MSLPNSREFFKIVQDHQLQNGELRIPKLFAHLHWKGISNPIILILPNGVVQKTYWEKRDGDIWLKKNWEKIAESLEHGFLLVFKYLGGSHFKVKIYDSTTLQIDYSTTKCAADDQCTEISDERELTQALKKNKKKEKNSHKDGANTSRSRGTRKRKNNIEMDDARGNMNKKAKEISTTKQVVNERARNSFPDDENPSFTINLSRTYLEGDFLNLPRDFSRKYRNTLEGTSASIRAGGDSDSKIWEVKFKFSASKKTFVMSNGWKLFTQVYNLKVDDACKFEMIQLEPVSFTITITPARERPFPQQLQDISEGRNVNHNTFKITVKSLSSSSSSSYPIIPNEFLRRHRRCIGNFVLLKVGKTSCSVKVKYYNNNNNKKKNTGFGRFSAGWPNFVKGCNLKIGDTCFFEMIDEEKLVFKVSITRH